MYCVFYLVFVCWRMLFCCLHISNEQPALLCLQWTLPARRGSIFSQPELFAHFKCPRAPMRACTCHWVNLEKGCFFFNFYSFYSSVQHNSFFVARDINLTVNNCLLSEFCQSQNLCQWFYFCNLAACYNPRQRFNSAPLWPARLDKVHSGMCSLRCFREGVKKPWVTFPW